LNSAIDAAMLFDRYDTNEDGFLSRADFLQLVRIESARRGTYFVKVHALFKRLALVALTNSALRTADTVEAPLPAFGAPPVPGHYCSPFSKRRSHGATRPPVPVATDLPPKYTWFDETIGVPVSAAGADSARSAGHSVTTLKEAYQARVAKLQEQLAVMLLPKRERAIQMASVIRSRIDEVQSARLAVERETVMDCEAILDRLRSSESVKLATLNQSSTEIDAEVEAIDRLTQHIDGVRFGYHVSGGFGVGVGRHDTPSGMLSFIQNYPDFVRSVERSASRALPREPIADEEEIAALTDFKRETKERTDALAREERYDEALAVKDRMLWEVIQGHKDLEEKLEKEKVCARPCIGMLGSRRGALVLV
jgi:hypothetical protein